MNIKMLKVAVAGLALSVSGFANAGLITNGDFETGDLTGWTIAGLGNSTCPTAPGDWNVSSTSSTGCTEVSNPISGSYAAYNMLDGANAMEYRLSQIIDIDTGFSAATLDWMHDAIWSTGTSVREFTIDIYDVTGVNLLANLYSESYVGVGSTNGWQSHSIDISSSLSIFQGQSVSLAFATHIPATWTGPAGFGLDAISLEVETADVPEPSTLAIFALGMIGLASRRFKRQS